MKIVKAYQNENDEIFKTAEECMNSEKDSKYVMCEKCNGNGYFYISEHINYGIGDRRSEMGPFDKEVKKDCWECGRTGFRKLKKVPIIEEVIKGYEYV